MATSLPRMARKSLRLPSSWATEINFQSRYPGGTLTPKSGAAAPSSELDAGAQDAAMPATAATAISNTTIRFRAASFACGYASSLQKLLASIDVVGDSRDRSVHHEMDRERGEGGRTDHSTDGQRFPELLATRVQLITQNRCRQRRVNEAGRNQVYPDGRQLKRERPGQRRRRCGE